MSPVTINPDPQGQDEIETARRRAANAPAITINPERLAGAPVIGLSRVPVATLLDHLAAGDTLADFLRDFPSVDREKAIGALDAIKDAVGLASGLTTDEVAVREDPLMNPFTNHSVMTREADFIGREEQLRL